MYFYIFVIIIFIFIIFMNKYFLKNNNQKNTDNNFKYIKKCNSCNLIINENKILLCAYDKIFCSDQCRNKYMNNI